MPCDCEEVTRRIDSTKASEELEMLETLNQENLAELKTQSQTGYDFLVGRIKTRQAFLNPAE